MDLRSCIEKIVSEEFSIGESFDSHAVINFMFSCEEYFLVYLQGYEKEKTVAAYHSKIAEIIKSLNNVEDCKEDVKTLTIFGKFSSNRIWRKK